MRPRSRPVPSVPAVLAAALLAVACATVPASSNEGTVSLDVPYVTTPQRVVDRMLEMAAVTKDDLVYDLGSGDGRIVITAARRYGARGVGVDIDPARVEEGRRNAEAAGVTDRVRFVQQDLFETDLREATVVTMYLLQSVNLRLRPRLFEQLRPGTRIVSHTFDMEEWEPDATAEVDRRDGGSARLYAWVIPARADGTWDLSLGRGGDPRRIRLDLEQEFQKLRGTARMGDREVPIEEGRLAGDRVYFTIRDGEETLSFAGRVDGARMAALPPNQQESGVSGAAAGGSAGATPALEWRATRVGG